MNELAACAAFLVRELLADSDVTDLVGQRVYDTLAPQGSQLPCIVFSHLGGMDLNTVGSDRGRIFSRPQFVIEAVSGGEEIQGFSEADVIASALDAALTGDYRGAAGAIEVDDLNYQVSGIRREQPLRRLEDEGAVRYYRAGGIYRLFVHGL